MEPARGGAAPGRDGRIPFTFRIGVTGHRDLADPDALRAPVREALSRLTELAHVAPETGLPLVLVSALAEGADRLVAEEALADYDARLEVALPLAADDYAKDFKTEVSKQEFRSLLDRASDTWQAPAGLSREEAYERAGRYVVDRCDAIVVLWDGEGSRGRGGTAEIVGYAQEQGVPIAWVHTKGDPGPSYAGLTDQLSASWRLSPRLPDNLSRQHSRCLRGVLLPLIALLCLRGRARTGCRRSPRWPATRQVRDTAHHGVVEREPFLPRLLDCLRYSQAFHLDRLEFRPVL